MPEDDVGEGALPKWIEQSDGQFSPPPVLESDVAEGAVIVHEADDREMLSLLRRQVCISALIDNQCVSSLLSKLHASADTLGATDPPSEA
jgi:hypothetical protein